MSTKGVFDLEQNRTFLSIFMHNEVTSQAESHGTMILVTGPSLCMSVLRLSLLVHYASDPFASLVECYNTSSEVAFGASHGRQRSTLKERSH